MPIPERYATFRDFYPFYLSEHRNPTCRRLHFIGTSSVLLVALYVTASAQWRALWLVPMLGYGFAWTGHYFFEKNRPATLQYPLYSLLGDFKMFAEMLTGKLAR